MQMRELTHWNTRETVKKIIIIIIKFKKKIIIIIIIRGFKKQTKIIID